MSAASQSDTPIDRYHRQTLVPAVGQAGQTRLAHSRALIVGCGALGTVVADSLCRAGVGHLTIVDRDVVEWTNLQRQVLFDEHDAEARTAKAEAAAARLSAINHQVKVEPVAADLNSRNVLALCESAGAVIDATDNFQTRYLLNDACVKLSRPLIYAGVIATAGMTMTILPGVTPCLRCIFPDPPAPGTSPTCDTAGVLGPAVGAIASLQAAEALKILLGHTEAAARTLREIDVWSARLRAIQIERNPSCPCCVQHRFDFLEAPVEDSVTLCGSDAVQVLPSKASTDFDLDAIARRLSPLGPFTRTRHMLRGFFPGENLELTLFADGRAIFKGTTDPLRAKSLYARYVGE